MNYGKKLFTILAAAIGMVIAITGLGFASGQYTSASPKAGYALIIIGGFLTVFYINKLRKL